MLVIRLQRRGKKKQASFRVVLQEKTWQPKGKAIEILGFYNPHTKEKNFQAERINYWISKGAQMTPTLHNLLVDAKVIDGPKVKAWTAKPKKKKDAEQTQKTPDVKEPAVEESIEVKNETKEEVSTEAKEDKSEPEAEKVVGSEIREEVSESAAEESPEPAKAKQEA